MSDYLHGTDESEQQRLEAQAKLLGGSEFLPPLRSDMRVLEIGCGTGAITREVASQVGEVIGIDREAKQLETARRLGQGINNLRFMKGEAEALEFPDATFDAVYCRFMLEHVRDPAQVLAEVRRIIKPGGWMCALEWEPDCIVNYPDSPAVESVWRKIYGLQASLGGDPWVGRKLYGLFLKAGFKPVQAEGQTWTVTGAESEKLALYLNGAREIIRQAQARLVAYDIQNGTVIQQALAEYQVVAESPAAFVLHVFCRTVGFKA